MLDGNNVEVLKKYENELADLFIVSHAYVGKNPEFNSISEFEQDGLTVKIQKASGEKCQRCWKYRELNADGICKDCEDAIK